VRCYVPRMYLLKEHVNELILQIWSLICVWPCIVNLLKNQLDATIVYWSTRSAQQVSGNHLPIFRSVRLSFFLQHMVSCCCGRQEFGERRRGTTCTVWRELFDNSLHTVHVVPRCRSPNPCLPQQQDTIPYAVKISLLRSWRWAKDCPKHVELIL